MTHETLNAAILTDSRGLDTYYLNDAYPAGYGIDRVFAYRLDQALAEVGVGNVRSFLIPDHFRGGTIDGNITRVALCQPRWVILCDGIWETLLNREKYVKEAQELGFLEGAVLDPMNDDQRREIGAVLNRLYFEDRLSVSPVKYARKLDEIVGYFARRRCTVMWLSLVVPPESHRNGVHAAGRYRPLPFWQDRLKSINDQARAILDRWGGVYVDLDKPLSTMPSLEHALIDQWHFSPDFHGAVAAQLAGAIEQAFDGVGATGASWSADCVTPPGRLQPDAFVTLGDRQGETGLPLERARSVLLTADAGVRTEKALSLLNSHSNIGAVLYPEDCRDPAHVETGGTNK